MPDIYTHYIFGGKVYKNLPPEIISEIDKNIFDFAQNGPDDWAAYSFYCHFLRHNKNNRSGIMHRENTGEFLVTLADAVKREKSKSNLFSYFCGYLCHYILDYMTHSYIVYKSGIYNGTKETKQYKGLHLALEHSLDIRMMEREGRSLKDRPISHDTFTLMALPKNMKNAIDDVYFSVYQWENAYNDLNKARRDLKRFNYLAEDPHGILYRIVYPFKKSFPGYFHISYYKDPYAGKDVENNAHNKWYHPFDDTLVSDMSFLDLFEYAASCSEKIIGSAYDYIYSGTVSKDTFAAMIGNKSYDTGFEPDDPRSRHKPTFDVV